MALESKRWMSPENAGWRLGLGTLLQGLNSSMIAVATAAISTHFNNAGAIPWLVSALYFTAAASSPTFGHLADLYGVKRMYDVGLLLTFVASVIGPFSPNIWCLIAARALLGIGTAAQMPTAVTIVSRIARKRGVGSSTAVSIISMLGQVSAAVGPVLGGVIVASLGWKWIFWINIPLLVNAFFWTRNIPNVEDVRSEFRERLDYLGIVIFCLAIILLLYGLLGTDMHRVLTGILASGLLFFVLHRHEKHVEVAPFIDFGFISSHRTVAYIYVRTIIVNVAFYTVFYGIPQWAEADKNMGASLAGFVLLPNFVAGVITTRFAASKAISWGVERLRVLGGGLLVVNALVAEIAFHANNMSLLYLATFILGMPSGFNNMGNQSELNRTVRPSQLGQATGMFRTAQFVGAAISTPLVFHILQMSGNADIRIAMLMLTIGAIGILVLGLDVLFRMTMMRTKVAVVD